MGFSQSQKTSQRGFSRENFWEHCHILQFSIGNIREAIAFKKTVSYEKNSQTGRASLPDFRKPYFFQSLKMPFTSFKLLYQAEVPGHELQASKEMVTV